MSYREHLNRWAIARWSGEKPSSEKQLDQAQWVVIARFRSLADAEGHLLVLRQKMPQVPLKVMFDLLEDTHPKSASADPTV